MLSPEPYVYPSEEVLSCPFEHYDAMRAYARIYKVPGRNEYVVTHHSDIQDVLRQPRLFSNRSFTLNNGIMRTATLADVHDTARITTFQSSDPPMHTVKRGIAFESFKPGAVKHHEASVLEFVDALINEFIQTGTV